MSSQIMFLQLVIHLFLIFLNLGSATNSLKCYLGRAQLYWHECNTEFLACQIGANIVVHQGPDLYI